MTSNSTAGQWRRYGGPRRGQGPSKTLRRGHNPLVEDRLLFVSSSIERCRNLSYTVQVLEHYPKLRCLDSRSENVLP